MPKATSVASKVPKIVLIGMLKTSTNQWPTVAWNRDSREVKVGSDTLDAVGEKVEKACEVLGKANSIMTAKKLLIKIAKERGQDYEIL